MKRSCGAREARGVQTLPRLREPSLSALRVFKHDGAQGELPLVFLLLCRQSSVLGCLNAKAMFGRFPEQLPTEMFGCWWQLARWQCAQEFVANPPTIQNARPKFADADGKAVPHARLLDRCQSSGPTRPSGTTSNSTHRWRSNRPHHLMFLFPFRDGSPCSQTVSSQQTYVFQRDFLCLLSEFIKFAAFRDVQDAFDVFAYQLVQPCLGVRLDLKEWRRLARRG